MVAVMDVVAAVIEEKGTAVIVMRLICQHNIGNNRMLKILRIMPE